MEPTVSGLSNVESSSNETGSGSTLQDRPRMILDSRTLPIASILRRGNTHTRCVCEEEFDSHISYFEANNLGISPEGFCENSDTLFSVRLPLWATGLRERVNFVDLPTVYSVYKVFKTATWWWRNICEPHGTYGPQITREAFNILWSTTGLPLEVGKETSISDMMRMKTDAHGLVRLKNFISTLDGLMIQLLLAGKRMRDVNNWDFFDRVASGYFRHAWKDLFSTGAVPTYYSRLKKQRKVLKDKTLKERTSLEWKDIDQMFWFYRPYFNVLTGSIITTDALDRLGYLTQTRAAGLATRAVMAESAEKLMRRLSAEPRRYSEREVLDIRMSVRKVFAEIASAKKSNLDSLLNEALLSSKVSLSNSGSFSCPRRLGGKVEDARRLLEANRNRGFWWKYDLSTGSPIGQYEPSSTEDGPIGEELLHSSIEAYQNRDASSDTDPLRVRASIVEEPGKARTITLAMITHSLILHPLAHVFATYLQYVESTRAGLTAGNHLWEFMKRLDRQVVPKDGIFKSEDAPKGPMKGFMGSEDWTGATDGMEPIPAFVLVQEFGSLIGLPKYYVELCATLLTGPRLVFLPSKYFSEGDTNALSKEFRLHGGNFVFTKRRGVLQGDPLTKQVLHLSHLISRQIALNQLRIVGLQTNLFPKTKSPITGDLYGAVPLVTRTQEWELITSDEDRARYLVTFLNKGVFDGDSVEERKKRITRSILGRASMVRGRTKSRINKFLAITSGSDELDDDPDPRYEGQGR